jgi:hypothetical protein
METIIRLEKRKKERKKEKKIKTFLLATNELFSNFVRSISFLT